MLNKIKTDIENAGLTERDFFRDDVSNWDRETGEYSYVELDNYTFFLQKAVGGEGQGETYYKVFKFIDKTTQEATYVKFDGYYQSYDGSTYEECFVVAPSVKTVIMYDPA